MTPRPRSPDLFGALLGAPDRDPFPCARPVLSWREDDEPEYLDAIEREGVSHYELERRGVWHGRWTELDPARHGTLPSDSRRFHAKLQRRWHLAQPIVLPGAVHVHDARLAAAVEERYELHRRLDAGGSLLEWLSARLSAPFSAVGRAPLVDSARDLERISVAVDGRPDAGLWVKVGRLSTAEGDASLRMRFSFGVEGPDDTSSDEERHGLVRDLAESVFPEARAPAECTEVAGRLERLCAAPVTFTQHILYWNAPGGGALFHHDALEEPDGPAARSGEHRQLGVVYAQLAGRTAWLALSIEDLAQRVNEFVVLLEDGELPWVREPLEDALGRASLRSLAARDACLRELADPGCGRLAPLVNRGPEFTSYLADAGHAAVLHPGDAILLPNQTLACTAMHSVFCASSEVTAGLSVAIRRRPAPGPPSRA